MKTRRLGKSEIEVAPLGMGCWAIGGIWQFADFQAGWGQVDDNESIRAIQHALHNGITLFDTAANYGAGHSETILGKALAGQRDKAIIATKFGHNVNEAAKHVTHHNSPKDVLNELRAVCERSLKHLNTDVIDLYQLHVADYPLEYVDDLLSLLEELVQEGKIRTYGWSTDSVERAEAFAKGAHCVAIQHDLNVVMDAPAMIALCEQMNLASVNRTPLARGALTGKYTQETVFPVTDVRNETWGRENVLRPAFERLETLRDLLTSGGRTLTQGALAWIWGRSPMTFPIPGIRTVAQVEEHVQALSFGAFTADEMRQISEVLRDFTSQKTA
jgi:aryl-alcohol dehydrogenase-like predicted oxidoreductase